MRDPEWWIQSDNAPWRNPYARWGTEHGTSLYEERYIRPEFVVSVDTSHPSIRRVLEDGLNKAEDMLDEKASFAIEVSGAAYLINWTVISFESGMVQICRNITNSQLKFK